MKDYKSPKDHLAELHRFAENAPTSDLRDWAMREVEKAELILKKREAEIRKNNPNSNPPLMTLEKPWEKFHIKNRARRNG